MKTFKQFLKTPIPAIHLDIRDNALVETIHVPLYDNFVGAMDESPYDKGYRKSYGCIFTHPSKPGKYFYFGGSNKPKEFDLMGDAVEHDINERTRAHIAIERVGTHLGRHYSLKPYTDNDKQAVNQYTHAFSSINRKIINNSHLDEVDHALIHNLDGLLQKHETPDNLIVYSGTNSDHADSLKTNTELYHPAFLSSTLDMKRAAKIAAERDGSVVALHIPKGHPGFYVGEKSQVPAEREFIIPRGQTLHIDHTKRQTIVHERANSSMILHHAYLKF